MREATGSKIDQSESEALHLIKQPSNTQSFSQSLNQTDTLSAFLNIKYNLYYYMINDILYLKSDVVVICHLLIQDWVDTLELLYQEKLTVTLISWPNMVMKWKLKLSS